MFATLTIHICCNSCSTFCNVSGCCYGSSHVPWIALRIYLNLMNPHHLPTHCWYQTMLLTPHHGSTRSWGRLDALRLPNAWMVWRCLKMVSLKRCWCVNNHFQISKPYWNIMKYTETPHIYICTEYQVVTIPFLGKILILTNIFQMGWFNHQLAFYASCPPCVFCKNYIPRMALRCVEGEKLRPSFVVRMPMKRIGPSFSWNGPFPYGRKLKKQNFLINYSLKGRLFIMFFRPTYINPSILLVSLRLHVWNFM